MGTAPPRPAMVMDGACLALLAGALFVAIAGRGLLLGFGQFVLPSASILLFASAAVLVIRHVAYPRPGIRATFAIWRARLDAHPHAASALRAFMATRPLVFLVAYFAVVTIGLAPKAGFTLSTDPLGNLPARFDAGWYGAIAVDGYEWDRQFGRQRNIAFFPAMPMLMRPVGMLFGMNTMTMPREKRMLRALWAGVCISLAAFLWGLYYLSKLSGHLSGEQAAAATPLLLAAYPFAAFFNAPYSESLFLLGSVGAFYHFHRGRWIPASLFGLLVGFSRPNGCLLSIPLAMLAVQQMSSTWRTSPGESSPSRRPVAPARTNLQNLQNLPEPPRTPQFTIRLTPLVVASMPGVAMLIFTAYLYRLTGVWLVWARMHEAWGRKWGTGPIAQGWEWLTTEGLMAVFQGVPFDTLNTFAVLFALVLTWAVFRRLGVIYATFVLVNLIPPIFAGGALSMGRVTATLFPLFIALGASLRPQAVAGWAAAFGVLQGFVVTLFFTWRELF